MLNNFAKFATVVAVSVAALCSSSAQAALYTEDFEASFPTWESNWLGTNSNLQNYYGVGQGRGNNPDGLWIADGLSNGSSVSDITFMQAFGSSISSFSIDVTSWITGLHFIAYDMNNSVLVNILITSYAGAYSDPGTYQNISFNTGNGLSHFTITGGGVEGNTSIDNVVVNTGSQVPEPASLALLGLGLTGVFASLRKRNA